MAGAGRPALPRDVRVAFWDGVRVGLGVPEAAAAAGVARATGQAWVREAGGVKGNGPAVVSGRFLARCALGLPAFAGLDNADMIGRAP